MEKFLYCAKKRWQYSALKGEECNRRIHYLISVFSPWQKDFLGQGMSPVKKPTYHHQWCCSAIKKGSLYCQITCAQCIISKLKLVQKILAILRLLYLKLHYLVDFSFKNFQIWTSSQFKFHFINDKRAQIFCTFFSK